MEFRVVTFDDEYLGTVTMDYVPISGDMITLKDSQGSLQRYGVYSRYVGTRPDADNPINSIGDDIVVIVYTQEATTPDHDYEHGGYIPNKYRVMKGDGTPTDPNANYFVLRLDTDPNALVALKVYADSVESNGNAVLANDIRDILIKMREHQKRVDKRKG